MKSRRSLRRTVVVAAFLAMSAALLTCHSQTPVTDWTKFDTATIEANLTTLDSAGVIYAAQFAAGDIDAAAQQAYHFLLSHPGVDTAEISPDSLVWAFFTNGLLAGVGDVRRGTPGSFKTGPEREPAVKSQGGGELFNLEDYVLPFDTELPGTKVAADAVQGIFKSRLNWDNKQEFDGAAVDLSTILREISSGTNLIFWSGHGMLFPPEPGAPWSSGLVLGATYTGKSLAQAAVTQYAGYLDPGAGQLRQASVVRFVGEPDYHIVLLPPFISIHGSFNARESLPYFNASKSLVYLSCCYSAYTTDTVPGALVQAFLDAGADVVCGYSWEVTDDFSCNKDTLFFGSMADTCFPLEAEARLGILVDPTPLRMGIHAKFLLFGDSMVLLHPVFQAKLNGTLMRPSGTTAARAKPGTIFSSMHPEGSTQDQGLLEVLLPDTIPGSFNCITTDNATIQWTDLTNNQVYVASKDCKGVSGQITVTRNRADAITGSFSGTLGYWATGVPTVDPPTSTMTVTDGCFKYTGKIPQALSGSPSAEPSLSPGLTGRPFPQEFANSKGEF